MKIKTRFFIVLMAVVLGFVSVVGLASLFIYKVNQLKTINVICFETINRLKQLQLLSAELLSTDDLDRTFEQWQNCRDEFSSSIEKLNESPHIHKLLKTERERSILKSMYRFWRVTRQKLDWVEQKMEKLISRKDYSKNGLLLQYFDNRNYENFTNRNSVYNVMRYLESEFETKLTRLINMMNSTIDERFISLIVQILIISLIIAGVVSFILFSFLLRLKNFLGRLHNSMNIIGRGDFTEKLSVDGKDEFSQIAKAINLTTTKIDNIHTILEQRVKELSIARREAEAAGKAKAVFLAKMSHELRTPLNSILGFSHHIAQHSNITAQQKKELSIINKNGKHLLLMINDILVMAGIEAGMTVLNKNRSNLFLLFDDLQMMFKLKAEEKNLFLVFIRHPDFPKYVTVDDVKLRQVLTNLINNALKFTFQGGVEVIGGIEQSPDSDKREQRITFEIRDTGKGISKKDQDSVFEPFVQLQTGKIQEGTGLGLSICRDYVHLMAGEIFIESSSTGTVFSFYIPVPEKVLLGQEKTKSENSLDKIVKTPGPMVPAMQPQVFSLDLFENVPEVLLADLEQAAVCAEMDKIILLIEQISDYNKPLAEKFSMSADMFDYDLITVFLEKRK